METDTTDYLKIPLEGLSLTETTQLVQYALILRALKQTNNNKAQAARLLGMNRTTLFEMLKRLEKVCDGRLF